MKFFIKFLSFYFKTFYFKTLTNKGKSLKQIYLDQPIPLRITQLMNQIYQKYQAIEKMKCRMNLNVTFSTFI